MSVVGGVRDGSAELSNTDRVVQLWDQAEAAMRAGQNARARRYFRWIARVCPDDAEPWLRLAHLASDAGEGRDCLLHAYALAPDNRRVLAALRQARTEQLESSVGQLQSKPAALRCLPDERQVNGRDVSLQNNGQRSRTTDADREARIRARSLNLSSWAKSALPRLTSLLPLAICLANRIFHGLQPG